MTKMFYYKDIKGDDESLNLQLEASKAYRSDAHNSCRQMEKKAQFILQSSLTMLTIFFAIAAFITKQNKECLILSLIDIQNTNTMNTQCSFAMLISLLIVIAAIYSIRTFKPKTYHFVGDDEILKLDSNPKEKLIAYHLTYAESCAELNKYKSINLKKSYTIFKFIICLMFVYICCICLKWDHSVLSYCLNGLTGLIFLIALGKVVHIYLPRFIKQIKEDINPREELLKESRQRKIAYEYSQKYPDNTAEENWHLAEEQIKLDADN